MSQFVATIKKINSIDNLNIVEFDFHGLTLKMMSLDLNENIQIGKKVIIVHLVVLISGGSFMNESFQRNESRGGTNRNDST